MIEGTLRRRWSLRRILRAQLRDLRVLASESRGALFALVIIVFGSALALYLFYADPATGQKLNFPQSLYGAFTLLFFANTLGFPHQWYLQLLYFIVPILGLVAVVDGLVRFGAAVTNKQERGQKWQTAMASTYNQHIIIVGIGKVGYRVALELLKFEREVVAIEINPGCRFIDKAADLGIPVIIADARTSESLVKAGIEKADAVIPCTDNELTNLDIALDARELNPGAKIVMRMYDADLAKRIEKGFGIHTAYSVSALAAPTIAAASLRVKVRSSFYVGETLLHISEFTIGPDSPLAGWSVRRLEEQLDLSVVSCFEESGMHLHPEPDQPLRPGGRILVMATLDTLHQLNKLNR